MYEGLELKNILSRILLLKKPVYMINIITYKYILQFLFRVYSLILGINVEQNIEINRSGIIARIFNDVVI